MAHSKKYAKLANYQSTNQGHVVRVLDRGDNDIFTVDVWNGMTGWIPFCDVNYIDPTSKGVLTVGDARAQENKAMGTVLKILTGQPLE